MQAFRREQDRYVAGLDLRERKIIAGLVDDVAQLLGAERFENHPSTALGTPSAPQDPWPRLALDGVPVTAPADPAVRRLLPDASTDARLAAEFRRLTETELRSGKLDRLRRVWALLHQPVDLAGRRPPPFAVSQQDAPMLAAALTDLRLVLADRLGLVTDADGDRLYAELAAAEAGVTVIDETRAYLGSLYSALSWLQESLLEVMLSDLDGV